MAKKLLYFKRFSKEWIIENADFILNHSGSDLSKELSITIAQAYRFRDLARKFTGRLFKTGIPNLPNWVLINERFILENDDHVNAHHFGITVGKSRVIKNLLRDKRRREPIVELIYLPDYWKTKQSSRLP